MPCRVVTSFGALVAQHLLGEQARDGVGDRVVDVEEVEVVLARGLGHLGREGQVVGRVLEEEVGGHVHLVEADVLAGSPPRRKGSRYEMKWMSWPRRASCLPSSAATAPEPPTVGIAGDPDPHSAMTWWPRAQGSIAASASARQGRGRGGRGARREARPRSWKAPPGKSASRVRRSRSARAWSRFFRARSDFSCRASRSGGGRGRGPTSAAPRSVGSTAARRLSTSPSLALHRLAGAREGGLDLGVGLARPPRHDGLGIALRGRASLRPSASRVRAWAGLHEGDAGPGQEHGAGDAEVRVGRARSGRGRRSPRARRRRPRSAAARPGPAGAGARPGSSRPGSASSSRTASSTLRRAPGRAPRRCRCRGPAPDARPPSPRTG